MYAEWCDFNGAAEYFAGAGAPEWRDIAQVVEDLPTCFQASDQAGIRGTPIFDPKATNLALTMMAAERGWRSIPVPAELRAFGDDWDGGKRRTLAEWQFSNYPFLWNNVIRTDAVFKQGRGLGPVERVDALIFVTKSGVLPSSNSSLYYEQGRAQLDVVTTLDVFDVPIRFVGLGVRPGATEIEAAWTTYEARTSRTVRSTERRTMRVIWGGRASKYGVPRATFHLV